MRDRAMLFGCRVIACVAGLLVLRTSAARADNSKLEIAAGLTSYYTSNLYQVSDRQKGQFESRSGPGQRFHDMEGPEDFVTVPGLDLTWHRRLAKDRNLKASFGADYSVHARNTIADYLRVGAALDFDLTQSDTLGVRGGFIPERFSKNLSTEDPNTQARTFAPARYQKISVRPHYMHDWNKDWSTGVEYEYAARDYKDPFHNRDRRGHTVMGLLEYNGLKGIAIDLDVGYNTTRTPKGIEFGIEVDRSFNEVILGGAARFKLPGHWRAKVRTEYRVRHFTTDVEEDTTYFDRRDNTWTLDAEIGRKLGKNLYLAVLAGYGHRDLDRSDPTVTADEVGYTESWIGLVGEWVF